MLPRLIFVVFIVDIQALAYDEFVLSPQVMAQAFQQAEQLRDQANKLIAPQLSSNNTGQTTSKSCLAKTLDGDKSKGCLQKLPTSQNKVGQIIVFVSFSMSGVSLKSLYQAAHKHNAVLVMRGLYQDSFVKTAQKLQELGVTIDINPELFEKHQITTAPTFLFIKGGQPICSLKGNVTLDFVAKKFAENEVKEVPCVSLIP